MPLVFTFFPKAKSGVPFGGRGASAARPAGMLSSRPPRSPLHRPPRPALASHNNPGSRDGRRRSRSSRRPILVRPATRYGGWTGPIWPSCALQTVPACTTMDSSALLNSSSWGNAAFVPCSHPNDLAACLIVTMCDQQSRPAFPNPVHRIFLNAAENVHLLHCLVCGPNLPSALLAARLSMKHGAPQSRITPIQHAHQQSKRSCHAHAMLWRAHVCRPLQQQPSTMTGIQKSDKDLVYQKLLAGHVVQSSCMQNSPACMRPSTSTQVGRNQARAPCASGRLRSAGLSCMQLSAPCMMPLARI